MTKFSEALALLEPMQRRFVEEMLEDPTNQLKAARRAGYSEGSVKTYSSELMRNPKVKAAFEAGMEELANKMGLTPMRILQELCRIAFSNVGDLLSVKDIESLDREQLAGLTAEISIRELSDDKKIRDIKIKPLSKEQALMLLGKHLGMFKDKVEVSGSVSLEQLVAASMKETETN